MSHWCERMLVGGKDSAISCICGWKEVVPGYYQVAVNKFLSHVYEMEDGIEW